MLQVYLPTTEKLITHSDYDSTTYGQILSRLTRDSASFEVTATDNTGNKQNNMPATSLAGSYSLQNTIRKMQTLSSVNSRVN